MGRALTPLPLFPRPGVAGWARDAHVVPRDNQGATRVPREPTPAEHDSHGTSNPDAHQTLSVLDFVAADW